MLITALFAAFSFGYIAIWRLLRSPLPQYASQTVFERANQIIIVVLLEETNQGSPSSVSPRSVEIPTPDFVRASSTL
jgi:hypothetical protein